MRKPLERNNGKYVVDSIFDEIDNFSFKVANELCDKFTEIDIIDLQHVFEGHFRYCLMRRLARESAGLEVVNGK